MKLTEDQLKKIEEAGRAQIPEKKVALLIGVSWNRLRNEFYDEDSETYQSYERGKTESRLKIHSALADKAENGDGQAAKQLNQLTQEWEVQDGKKKMMGYD